MAPPTDILHVILLNFLLEFYKLLWEHRHCFCFFKILTPGFNTMLILDTCDICGKCNSC